MLEPMSCRTGELLVDHAYEEIDFTWKINNIAPPIHNGPWCWISPDFFFADTSWYFRLHYNYVPDDVSVSVWKNNWTQHLVAYDYGVKKLDGSVEHLGKGVFREYETGFRSSHLMKAVQFCERQSELIVSNVLTLTCSLKHGSPRFSQPRVFKKPTFKKQKMLNTLSHSLKDLFHNKESCDTTLHVMGKVYKAHKAILIARSPVFATMLRYDTKEIQTGSMSITPIITISDCDPDSFKEFLKYLYCGKPEVLSCRCALHLYETSHKYGVQDLKSFCIAYLKKNMTEEIFVEVVITADKYNDTILFSAAQEFFNKNLNQISECREWETILKDNYRLAKKLLKGIAKVVN